MEKLKADPEKIKNELIAEAIKKNPKNWGSKLEELGFTWVDDGYGDEEEIEEKLAKPMNQNQEFLLAYFEGHVKLSAQVLDAYLTEKNADKPNYPLIRKYYKEGNPNLKALILYGLKINPTDIDLLYDLSFFHQHNNILRELIEYYLLACMHAEDLVKFEELAKEFYYDTDPDGYDALHALSQHFDPNSEKGKIVAGIIKEEGQGLNNNGVLQ